ncbi:MAG: PBP1A family penicillin-binding protein [bacterium]|nr:PBP1A family penicillin-binding protein [bacterium]
MAKRRKKRVRRRRKGRQRRWPRFLAISVLVLGGVLATLIWPFWQLSGQFGHQPAKQPSRLYGAATVLRLGAAGSAGALTAELEALGYHRVEGASEMAPGTFQEISGGIELYRRRFPPPQGADGRKRIRVLFRGGVVAGIETDGGAELRSASLDPPLIASYYGPELRERRPVGLDELPEDLVFSVLAAEDAYFLEHKGLSVVGILRAAWVNLRAQEVRQGGSTLTQQLVKNLYLTQKRTLVRKLKEAVLAVFLELRYDKRAILEAYLNEIYWGRSGSVDLMGVGAASWAYFGKHPSTLTLSESALLAGMIQAPGNLSPLNNPEAARGRRDFVLERLAELRWVEEERLEAAASQEVKPQRRPLVTRHAPFFAAAMEEEARRRFGVETLDDAGYVLHSTLSGGDQRSAEEAVRWGVGELEKGWEKGRETKTPLEAALVSLDPETGGILAYVGGRNYGRSQFDRVTRARRQAGSAFKPIVYAAAFEQRVATPATILEDAPLQVMLAGRRWSPQNSDGKYRGWITSRTALEQSLNVPTARLALDVGLDNVVDLARRMGVQGQLDPYPAIALGAAEVSPMEMATVYATLAAGGRRPTIHGLEAVIDRLGEPVTGEQLAPPQAVLEEDVAFLITRVLQGVFDRGTGRSARAQGIEDPLAGKTGTTNSRRDSWFAGYAPERISLVWVGYDDNSETRLSGARAALPIWSRFTYKVRPAGGYSDFQQPEGVTTALIDPATGALATDRCPTWAREFFLRDFVPRTLCPDHRGWRARPLEQPDGVEPERKRHPFKKWLEMLRGRKKKDKEVI